MTATSQPEGEKPDSDDEKLVTLARAARARIMAEHGAAVRDDTGRTYSGADVTIGGRAITALQLALAQARAAGGKGIEAAAVVGDGPCDISDVAAEGGTGIPVWIADRKGTVTDRLVT